jgi:hypothetical protein
MNIKVKSANLDNFTVEYKPEFIEVYLNDKTLLGKITVFCENVSTKRNFDITLVYVDIGTGLANPYTKAQAEEYLNQKSHNQLFVSWNIDTDTFFAKKEMDSAVAIINRNPNEKLQDKLLTLFIAEYNKRRNILASSTKHIYFITNHSLTYTRAGVSYTTGAAAQVGKTYGIQFLPAYSYEQDLAHEIGHNLNFKHTFEPEDPQFSDRPAINQNSTNNFMDYNTTQEEFFMYQLKIVK